MKISLAMIVKNEEKNIKRCIDSVKELVDEIVIVDTGSVDNTLNIIKKYSNVKLYHFDWCDDFSAARNYSLEMATGDYVLVLDADEHVVGGSKNELINIMKNNYIGRILIESNFKKDNQEYRSNAYVSRFFPKEIRYIGAIHEQLATNKRRKKINIKVKHSGYYEKNKCSRNIPLLLKEVKKNPNDSYYLFQLGKELRINKQYEESFYFLMKAYKLTSIRSSYYVEIILELINCGKECKKFKVLNVISDNEEILKDISDFHFTKGLYYLDICLTYPEKIETLVDKIESSFLTCLKLNEKKHIEYLVGSSTFLPAYNLGVYYEVTENIQMAIKYYSLSYEYGYSHAIKRINKLLNK